jgi:hypothetical protein
MSILPEILGVIAIWALGVFMVLAGIASIFSIMWMMCGDILIEEAKRVKERRKWERREQEE